MSIRRTFIGHAFRAFVVLATCSSALAGPNDAYIDAPSIRLKRHGEVLKLLRADRRWQSVKDNQADATIDLRAADGTEAFVAFSGGTAHNASISLPRKKTPTRELFRYFGVTAPDAPYRTPISLVWQHGFGAYKNATIIAMKNKTVIMLFFKPPTD